MIEFASETAAVEESETVFAEEDVLLITSPQIEELSDLYIGNWNTLVSQTNWEKGAVILRWRKAMIDAELPHGSYSDEAWARRVGNVTSQHVGRLRRVAERFGEKVNDYPNLFWSHFQTALDWDDAELWLEGASQNVWSVAQMRIQRWEAIGAPAELKPRDEDIFTAELDDEAIPRNDSSVAEKRQLRSDRTEAKISEIGAADIVEGFDSSVPPFPLDEEKPLRKEPKKSKTKNAEAGPSTGELLASLKDFSDLPSDLAEALETFKVAILNHKLSGWKDVTPSKLLKLLDAFKALVNSVEEE